mgnify:CR=1 FL=1
MANLTIIKKVHYTSASGNRVTVHWHCEEQMNKDIAAMTALHKAEGTKFIYTVEDVEPPSPCNASKTMV